MREPVFNVKDFGAVGDGANDDTPLIQKAIDAAGNAGRGTVFFPEGRYQVTEKSAGGCLILRQNIDYRGVGHRSELFLAPNQPATSYLMYTGNVGNLAQIRIMDLQLNGNRWNQNQQFEHLAGIFLQSCQWCQIERCLIRDFVGDGIRLYPWAAPAAPNALFVAENNYVSNNEFFGIGRVVMDFAGASHSIAQNNWIHDCDGHSFKMEVDGPPASFAPIVLVGNTFANNKVTRAAGAALSIGSNAVVQNMTIRNNRFEDTSFDAAVYFYNTGTGCIIQENLIYRPERMGIAVFTAAPGVTVSKNTIREAGHLRHTPFLKSVFPAGPIFEKMGAITFVQTQSFSIDTNDVQFCYLPGIMIDGCLNATKPSTISQNTSSNSVKSLYTIDLQVPNPIAAQPPSVPAGVPAGLWIANSSGMQVSKNSFGLNTGAGILLSEQAANNTFRCNTLNQNAEGEVWVWATAGAGNDFGTATDPGKNTFTEFVYSNPKFSIQNNALTPLNAVGNYFTDASPIILVGPGQGAVTIDPKLAAAPDCS